MTSAEHEGEPYSDSRQRLRARLFHMWFLLRRPMTLGARAVVHDVEAGKVLLVRHTYVAGWQLPGGGVEPDESLATALERELREEGNIELTGPPELVAMYFNRHASRRDHVGLYHVRRFRQTAPHRPDREIAEAAFFRLDALPDETTPATRRRLAELFDGAAISSDW